MNKKKIDEQKQKSDSSDYDDMDLTRYEIKEEDNSKKYRGFRDKTDYGDSDNEENWLIKWNKRS